MGRNVGSHTHAPPLAKVYQLELVYSRCVVRFNKWGRRYQFALEAVACSDIHLLQVCPQKNADTNELLSMLHERSALCSLKWNCRHVCVQYNSSTQSASTLFEGQLIRRCSRAKIAIRAHGGSQESRLRLPLSASSSDPFNRLCTGRPGPSLRACPLIQASGEGDVLLIGCQNASSVTLPLRSNNSWTA